MYIRGCIGLSFVEIPYLAVIEDAAGYGFGRIDHRPSSYGKYEINALPAAQVYAFVYFG